MAAKEFDTYAVFHVGERLVSATIAEVAEVCAVPGLSQLLVSAPGLLGSLQLRGRMIPLYDLEHLCGAQTEERAPKLAVILQHEDRLIGLRMDRMEGFISLSPADIQEISGTEQSASAYTRRCFWHGEKFVSIINNSALFSDSRLPTALRDRPDLSRRAASDKRPHLKSTLGRAQIAIDARVIQNTVPRRAVDHGALSVGACLGSITHNGSRIPVMNTGALLGLGDAKPPDTPEIVLLKLSDERRIGLAFDTIDSMQAIDISELAPTPETLGDVRHVLSRVRLGDDPSQVFILDLAALEELPVIKSFAELSDDPPEQTQTRTPDEETGAITYAQERFLIFTAGRRMAAPAAQIRRIIPMPETIVPLDDRFRPAVGVFSVDGLSATVIHLRDVAGGAGTSSPPSHALLVPLENTLFAFAVEEVNGLASSVWLAGGDQDDEGAKPTVVNLAGEDQSVLPLQDLRGLAAEITRRTAPKTPSGAGGEFDPAMPEGDGAACGTPEMTAQLPDTDPAASSPSETPDGPQGEGADGITDEGASKIELRQPTQSSSTVPAPATSASGNPASHPAIADPNLPGEGDNGIGPTAAQPVPSVPQGGDASETPPDAGRNAVEAAETLPS